MTGGMVRDSRGNPLREGDRVEAWLDTVRYVATVKAARPEQASDGSVRRLILVRDGDGAEIESYSDAVVVIGEREADAQGGGYS